MTTEIIEGELVDSKALAISEPPTPALFGTTDPVEVIEKAGRVANALKDVLKKRGLIANIQGKEYVTLEGWTTLGAMLGVFPVDVWTRPVEVEGKCIGWEARVEARTLAGAVVGAAEAECLSTERRWKNADDYALRSMAQTRASSKALRMPLGFVVTLAGYSPTPAEEMTFAQDSNGATDAQCLAIATKLGELYRTEEGQATVKALMASYPNAMVGQRWITKRLTKDEADEVLEALA